MSSSFDTGVRSILKDNALSKSQKIDRLLELEAEARAVQRAASESGMAADDGLNRHLREVELALEQLGANSPDTGAATL